MQLAEHFLHGVVNLEEIRFSRADVLAVGDLVARPEQALVDQLFLEFERRVRDVQSTKSSSQDAGGEVPCIVDSHRDDRAFVHTAAEKLCELDVGSGNSASLD